MGRSSGAMVLQRFLPGGPRPAPLAESERPTLDSLFRQHADSVHRLIARLLGPGARGADIEDLVQQAFLAAHRALPGFRGESKPSTWLYGITARTVYRELRNRTRHRRMVAALEAVALASPPAASTERLLQSRAELARVWRVLMEIAPKKRMVLVLHELEGLSGKEIAEALDIKEATVYTRLFHARRELYSRLGEVQR
ncbi:MAG: RNA polymerase sigma factor [Myxococcota bacterium]